MKKTKNVLQWIAVTVDLLLLTATVISDRRMHESHGEHNPCDCRGTCLSCLRG